MSDTVIQQTAYSGLQYTPQRRLITRFEYERMIAEGYFGPEERLELIEGEILEKMSKNPPHSVASMLTSAVLTRLFHEGYCIRNQDPFVVSGISEPEPDFAVVQGTPRDYLAEHPTTAALIVEVSDSTLAYDRTTKASLYARAGIAEYWVLNLVDRVLEVHRLPAEMVGQPFGWHYRSITRHTETETVSPLAAPQSTAAVADLLP